jgi:RimJ/RimL family protein N-acetyltransferase
VKAPNLESERLFYTPLDLSFASKRYVDWMNDKEVNKFMESGGDYSLSKLHKFLEKVEKQEILFWAIITKETKKHIGNIKIDPLSLKNLTGEYGLMIGDKNEWGKGYATEASSEILKFCFSKKLNLRKITLGVVYENSTALKLYRKLGFEQEGLLKKHAKHEGRWCDIVRMAKFNPNLSSEH